MLEDINVANALINRDIEVNYGSIPGKFNLEAVNIDKGLIGFRPKLPLANKARYDVKVKDVDFGIYTIGVFIPGVSKEIRAFIADIYDISTNTALCIVSGRHLELIPKKDINLNEPSHLYSFELTKRLNKSFKESMNLDKDSKPALPELTGGAVSYYSTAIPRELVDEYESHVVIDAESVINSLQLNWSEANIMKELFRTANGRKGKGKKNHTELYGAEKIQYYGTKNLANIKREKTLSY